MITREKIIEELGIKQGGDRKSNCSNNTLKTKEGQSSLNKTLDDLAQEMGLRRGIISTKRNPEKMESYHKNNCLKN